jgi:hypothetical protein
VQPAANVDKLDERGISNVGHEPIGLERGGRRRGAGQAMPASPDRLLEPAAILLHRGSGCVRGPRLVQASVVVPQGSQGLSQLGIVGRTHRRLGQSSGAPTFAPGQQRARPGGRRMAQGEVRQFVAMESGQRPELGAAERHPVIVQGVEPLSARGEDAADVAVGVLVEGACQPSGRAHQVGLVSPVTRGGLQ